MLEPEITNELSLHLDRVRSMVSETTNRLARPIRDLGIALIGRIILHEAGVHTVGDLVRWSRSELLHLDLMTPEWLRAIEIALAREGLRLRREPSV